MSKFLSEDKLRYIDNSLSHIWRMYNEFQRDLNRVRTDQKEIVEKLFEKAKDICLSIQGLSRALYSQEFDLIISVFDEIIDYEQFVAPRKNIEDKVKSQMMHEINLMFNKAFTLAFRREKHEEVKKRDEFDRSGIRVSGDVAPVYDKITGVETKKIVDEEGRYLEKEEEQQEKKEKEGKEKKKEKKQFNDI